MITVDNQSSILTDHEAYRVVETFLHNKLGGHFKWMSKHCEDGQPCCFVVSEPFLCVVQVTRSFQDNVDKFIVYKRIEVDRE